MRVRFAPSPTGQLHVGNARTALFNWLLARGKDGTFILRIEDTDAERSTRESEHSILEDLRWLGLDWDEGPDVGGLHGPYRQSERLHLYASYANELLSRRARVPLFLLAGAARRRSAGGPRGRPAAEVPRHAAARSAPTRRAARMEAGERPVIRFTVPESADVTFHDLVRGDVTFNTERHRRSGHRPIRRPAAYNFAVVIDDALMEITHVIRGEDHISNTPRQILLYEALGFTPPAVRAPVARDGPGPHAAVEAARRDARGGVPRARAICRRRS